MSDDAALARAREIHGRCYCYIENPAMADHAPLEKCSMHLVADALRTYGDERAQEQRERDAEIAYEAWDESLEFADSCCQKASVRIQKIVAAAIRR